MLQDKYGRLIIVGAFIVIGMVLISAPGMNSKNKSLEIEQLNFTSMPKENIKNTEGKALKGNEALPVSGNDNTIELSAEEKMLDAWGIRKTSVVSNNEVTPYQDLSQTDNSTDGVVSDEITDDSSVSENVVQKPKPKNDVIKVNGKCFAKPKIEPPMVKSECDTLGTTLGIQACLPDDSQKDGWAGAVRACGGIENMPDMDDLLAVARLLYKNNSIGIKESMRSKYKAFGSYSVEDIDICDTYQQKNLRYDKLTAEDLGFPVSGNYQIWGKTEINPKYALSLFYSENLISYNGCTNKNINVYYSMCRISCD